MAALVAADEGAVVEVRERGGPLLVLCEHASNRLPRALGRLGLDPSDLQRHIAYDPGAAELAAAIADRFASGLILQRFSRLAIDCNRAPSLPDAIPERSESTVIPGNVGLFDQEKSSRVEAFWAPFHAAVEAALNQRLATGMPTTVVTVHSFTPVYKGVSRPWHAGIIATGDRRFSDHVLAGLRQERDLVVGDDQPYSARDNVDYTVRRHGHDRGLPHVMIEVRNDLLQNPQGISTWTARLARALHGAMGQIDASSPGGRTGMRGGGHTAIG